MEYNTDHTIKKKTQLHTQGVVTSVTDMTLDNLQPVRKTNYVIDYTQYSGLKPHALTRVTEAPGWIQNLPTDDPRIKTKRIGYDANGNQVEIGEMFGDVATIQRRNIWDEQDRLLAVDLRPEDKTQHPIAIYTYDASGERIVRYNTDQFEVSTNSSEVAQMTKDNIMIYPSGLLMGRVLRKMTEVQSRQFALSYSKHYYIGAERISSKAGSNLFIARFPQSQLNSDMPSLNIAAIRDASNATVISANASLTGIYAKLELPPPALQSVVETLTLSTDNSQVAPNAFYFHPDHLGSSTYISNDLGVVSQHAEYLPFGELLVDEHKNSNNSPFKFNGKLLDEETGNYYYGARYYDPKWSSFISVDPLAEKTMDAYGYCYNNPINLVDPDGREAESPSHIIVEKNPDGTYKVVGGEANNDRGIYLNDGKGGKGEQVGTMKTTHSFFDDTNEPVIGANIDMTSTEGQDFVNGVIKDDPSLFDYMLNATNGEKYDFKSKGFDPKKDDQLQYFYRGSVDVNGNVGSARDFGNYGAGLVAARKGLNWGEARAGFDTYQGFKSNGISIVPTPAGKLSGMPIFSILPVREATTTIKAQQAGFNTGVRMFKP